MTLTSVKLNELHSFPVDEANNYQSFFLGVDHKADCGRFHQLYKKLPFHTGHFYIEDSVDDFVSSGKLSFRSTLPEGLTVRCWDDPSYCREMHYLLKVQEAYAHSINEKSHSVAELTSARQILKEFHANYCAEKQSSLSWLTSLWSAFVIQPFPDSSTQTPEQLFESRTFLHRAINEKKANLYESHFLKRQEWLCHSITSHTEWDSTSYWMAGSSHFSYDSNHPQSFEAEKMFLKAVKKTQRLSLCIDLR